MPIIESPAKPSRPPFEKAYLTEKEVANRLSISVKWLQKMRLSGEGIKYCKFGSAVRYAIEDVRSFELNAIRASTSEAQSLKTRKLPFSGSDRHGS